jgi:nitrogenase subunit NifH
MYYRSPEQDEAEGALRSAMNALGVQVFHHIRRSRQVDDSTFLQRPLLESSPKSGACRDYKIFTIDLMNAKGGDKHGV